MVKQMLVYKCRRCKGVLLAISIKWKKLGSKRSFYYYGEHVIESPIKYNRYNGLPTPQQIVELFGGKCPYCGAELNPNNFRIRIDQEEIEIK